MKNRKLFVILSLLLVAVLMLGACGRGGATKRPPKNRLR